MALELIYFIKSKDPEAKVIAEFGVRSTKWQVNFHKLKLIKALNGNLFVGFPAYKEGETFKDYWTMDKEIGKAFKEEALKIAQEHLEKTEPKPTILDQAKKEDLLW